MNQSNLKEKNTQEPIVIGIGASAGGLEALQQFLTCLSDDEIEAHYAFVIVQHLSPDYKSLMVEILSKHTNLKVKQIENDMPIEHGHIYLNAPKNNVIYHKQRLYLKEYAEGAMHFPINVFFETLAEELGPKSIGIILSGTGSDGTAGIRKIKENDGIVFVQDPKTAKFDGMPRNAIQTGLVDFILSPNGIADELLNLINISKFPTLIQDSDFQFTNEEVLAKIYHLLKKNCNIDFTYYKRNTIIRRIDRRMLITRKETLQDYLDFIEIDKTELSTLGKEVLIGVTNFFRDPEFFDMLQQLVVQDIVDRTPEYGVIRIWSAGCSTGEEAYSLAILFDEVLEKSGKQCEVKIFATDVDKKAIETANHGQYEKSIENDMSVERLLKYFTQKNNSYVVSKNIRKMIIFAPHNAFQDPPFGKLDLVCCRNVMIYFQQILQKNIFSIFHAALKHNGYLFLGKSESAADYLDAFTPVATAAAKIYQHNAFASVADLSMVTYTPPTTLHSVLYQSEEKNKIQEEKLMQDSVNNEFLEKHLPPCVVIDEKDNCVHFYGEYSNYVKIGTGKATLNIFKLVSDSLRLILSTAINRCRNEQKCISYSGVTLKDNDEVHVIDLSVDPILNKRKEITDEIAIIFNPHKALTSEDTEIYNIDKIATQRIIDLEQELHESKFNLKSSISELETVNEELQAANEELLTANEELQSSNEELQSVNEELYTVNTEYQQRVDELLEMSNDMTNFLSFTMIGILFVDSQMNIRKFTDYIGREFQLMEHDIGRPLHILSHSFPTANLIEDATEVMKSLTPIDREVVSLENKSYSLRITPYRTTDNIIKGLVITLLDSFQKI